MAQKKNTKGTTGTTTVRRITARDDAPVAQKAMKKPLTKRPATTAQRSRRNSFTDRGLRAYFAGAWAELKLVRWPTRANTWAMVGAVIGFTLLLTVFILLLDALFKFIFETILK